MRLWIASLFPGVTRKKPRRRFVHTQRHTLSFLVLLLFIYFFKCIYLFHFSTISRAISGNQTCNSIMANWRVCCAQWLCHISCLTCRTFLSGSWQHFLSDQQCNATSMAAFLIEIYKLSGLSVCVFLHHANYFPLALSLTRTASFFCLGGVFPILWAVRETDCSSEVVIIMLMLPWAAPNHPYPLAILRRYTRLLVSYCGLEDGRYSSSLRLGPRYYVYAWHLY